MERDAILLTPGPLTTTERTKRAMLRDWGSWDSSFIAVTTELRRAAAEDRPRRGLARRRAAPGQRHVRASRRRSRRSCRKSGHVLVLDNGAYCKRLRQAGDADGPQDDDPRPRRGPAGLAGASSTPRCAADASITHVGLIHCETGTGVLNPLQAIADVCARHGKGLIVDAMSSFAALPIDAREVALRRARRRQRQVPRGRAGDGLRLHPQGRRSTAPPATRTRWRWTCTTSTSTWRRPASGASRRRRTSSRRSPRRCASSRRRAASRARLARYTGQLRRARRRHEGARLRALPGAGDPGADHPHLPRARRPGLRLQALLRRASRRAASSSIRASSPRSRPSASAASARSAPPR